jgi:hypothetical protein
MHLCSKGAGRRRARPDAHRGCLVVLEQCGKAQSTHRHPLWVSGHARTVWEGAEHNQTPIMGVWSCSNGAGRCRARRHPSWCLVMVKWYGKAQSTTKRPSWVSGHAQMVRKGTEHNQMPIVGVWSCSNGTGRRRARPNTEHGCLVVLSVSERVQECSETGEEK